MTSPARRSRIRTGLGAVALAGLGLGALAAPAGAAAPAYVALGDSMPSGPLIPNITGPLACARSTHNYAHELAGRLGITNLRDVTCSGADTGDMTSPQKLSIGGVSMGTAPPQFDALSADTTLVTLTITGNDAGLVGIAQGCTTLDPNATPCKDKYVSGGVDKEAQRIDAIAPVLGGVLTGIHQRSPQAKVVVTGYGLYIKPGGCFPLQPLLPVDADFLQGEVGHLNQMIAQQAAQHDAQYVDLATPSAGHDSCQSPSTKWIEGYVPVNLAAPLHPNKNGEAAYARIIGDQIG